MLIIAVSDEHCSHSSLPSNAQESNQKGKKDNKTIQKIGDFLQGSPTFLGSKGLEKIYSIIITLLLISRLHQTRPSYLSDNYMLSVSAKRIMGLMSGKSPDGGAMSLKLKSKRDNRKHDRPDISSPMDIPAHQVLYW